MKFLQLQKHILPLMILGFLIGAYNGRIALWKDNDPQPWKVFPYPISALPAQEQQALKNGIPVESMDDLNKLLENFLS